VPLYYYLRDETEEPLSIDILDRAGSLVRHYSSEESDHERCRMGNLDPRRPIELKYPETKQGLNLWSWNLRSENIRCIPDIKIFAGFNGPRVVPGDYNARIRIGDHEQSVSFSIAADPRSTATDAEMRAWAETLDEVGVMIDDILRTLHELRTAREQIAGLMQDHPEDSALRTLGSSTVAAISAWEAQIAQLKHETYEDEDAWETMLAGQLRYLLDVIDETGAPLTDGAMTRLSDLQAEWAGRQAELRAIIDDGLKPINAWAREHGVNHVVLPGS
jgi:hypothetical protein